MPERHNRNIDEILGRGLLNAEAVSQRLRRRLLYRLARNARRMTSQELIDMVRAILGRMEPQIAAILSDAELMAWVSGLRQMVRGTPQSVLEGLRLRFPQIYPDSMTSSVSSPIGTTVRFPGYAAASRDLINRQIMTRADFDRLAADAKTRAFTVARVGSERVIGGIRDALAESFDAGDTLREFRKRIEDKLRVSPIGPSHVENVYRTNIQTAYAVGRESLLIDQAMVDTFPFAQYWATRDDRVRPEHLALETMGIQGTNVYRSDDPFWVYFTPPWSYNCRCTKAYLTVYKAASLGIVEAQRQLEGRLFVPTYRLEAIAFRPPNGFVGPGQMLARRL